MLVRRTLATVLALAVLLPCASPSIPAASAAGVPVSCGETLSGIGFLAGDLDCATPEYLPIRIKQGRLDLQGFTLLGAIVCEGSCKISNGVVGGPITGLKSIGVTDAVVYGDITTNGSVRVRNSTVAFGQRCISAYYGKVVVENSVITECRGTAVYATQNHAKVTNSSITNNRHVGVHGTKVVLNASTVTGNGFGIECGHSRLDDICDGGPDHGLECGPGVDCPGGSCVRGAICADVAAFKMPVLLRNSTCETSVIASNVPQTWYACSLD